MKVHPGMEVAGLTDVGCQREDNEDSYAYWEAGDDPTFARLGRLAIVADGMGGCEGGQFASRIAVDSVQESYSSAQAGDPQQLLLDAVRSANFRVQEKARATPSLRGMGTTLTAAAIVGSRLYFAHVGDSRLYLLHNGALRALTRDHTLVARLVETGVIRSEDADSHPQKHVLTAAVGVAEDVTPDAPEAGIALEKGDVLLLCTDGLWGQMTHAEIAGVLSPNKPEAAAHALVELAKDRGGPDNITVQVLRMS